MSPVHLRNGRLLLAPLAVAISGLSSSYVFPLKNDAILNAKGAVDSPVSRLQERLDKGHVKLKHKDDYGYLPSALKELGRSSEKITLIA